MFNIDIIKEYKMEFFGEIILMLMIVLLVSTFIVMGIVITSFIISKKLFGKEEHDKDGRV